MAPLLAFVLQFIHLVMLSLGGEVWQDDLQPKYRITQLDDNEVRRFLGNQTHSDHFKLLEQDSDFLLVGARNIVYNISLQSLQEKKRLVWYSTDADVSMCKLKGKSQDECQNYVRVLARKSKNTILVCGTNAFRPMCRQYEEKSGDYDVIDSRSGEGLCPYDPNHNSTAIYTDGNLYVATVAQFSGADPLIYRDPLRTEQFNFEHLNAPSFVSSLQHEEYVYFFFRETAVEYINCGKSVFSRVARVCTKDRGGPHKFRNRWTSFLKARLNCSIAGEFPFYFNEIQSTSQVIEGVYRRQPAQLIYAVFTTSLNSISGSAVCSFHLEDILKTFDGPFKGQEDINSNWLPVPGSKVPEPRPGQCVNDSRTLPEMTVNFIKDHTLMDLAVPAFWSHPLVLHTSFQYRYTCIAVDPQIQTTDGKKYDILFIGTDNGRVIKAFNAASASEEDKVIPVIIEETVVFSQKVPITNLLVYHTYHEAKLVVVSQEEIQTIPLHHCERHADTCSECVALQDPYCAWDIAQRICSSSSHRVYKSEVFIQNVAEGGDSRCPEGLQHIVRINPQLSPHHSASHHNDMGGHPSPFGDAESIEKGGLTDSSKEHAYIYTAETLAIAVTTSIVSSLVIGFISGYIFSRRCRTEEVESPYDEPPYLEQHHVSNRLGVDPRNINEGFLPSTINNKPINLVLNVPPKNGNGKNANSSADNKPIQKVKKIYL